MSRIREWCQTFVEMEYEEEIDLFPIIWDQVEKFRVSTQVQIPVDPKPPEIGLSIDSGRGIDLRTTWIALTVPAVLGELGKNISPSTAQVNKAIFECSQAFGASKAIAEELAERMAAPLTKVFGDLSEEYEKLLSTTGDSITGSPIESEAVCPTKIVYISQPDTAYGGMKTSSYDYAEGKDIASSTTYDIIVDEVYEHAVFVSSMEPIPIWDLTDTERGMLWLTLKNVGALVRHIDIRELWGITPSKSTLVVKPRDVYQYRKRFIQILGELAEVVIPSTGNHSKGWAIPLDGWSYRWIRSHKDESCSDLLTPPLVN